MTWLRFLVPNALTFTRLAAGIGLVAWWVKIPLTWPAFFGLAAAMLTDVLDGIVARRLGATTRFGALADPLADKVLNSAVAWAAYKSDALPVWYFPWLAALYVATAFAYGVNLLVRRPPPGQRVPRPHAIGRGAGLITALAVMLAVVPAEPLGPIRLPEVRPLLTWLTLTSIASTGLHLLLTCFRLTAREQRFFDENKDPQAAY